jgi:hypothetical protein
MTFSLYPVRNNAPLEFLTGFTSKVIKVINDGLVKSQNPLPLDGGGLGWG